MLPSISKKGFMLISLPLLSQNRPSDNVESLMREKLPAYVVKCLLAAGFDSAEVISSMDVTEGPKNSIEVIETFIDKHFRGNEEYYSSPVLASRPFVFPPGHKIRIVNFVSEVSSAIKASKRKQQNSRRLIPHKCHVLPNMILLSQNKNQVYHASKAKFSAMYCGGLKYSLLVS